MFSMVCGESTKYRDKLLNLLKQVKSQSEFEKVSEWDTTIQDTMEEYDNVER